MFKWNRYAPFWPHVTNNSSHHAKALTALCLSAASLLPLGAPIARAEEPTAPAAVHEESLLVATHEETAADSSRTDSATLESDAEALEPVAQSSDITPELATTGDGNDDDNKLQFGSPSSRVGQLQEVDAAKSLRRAPSVQTSEYPAEAVKFQGVLVGRSTKQELIDMWGEPADAVATAEGNVLAFDIDPFQAVEVLIGEGDVVAAIKIALASPLDPVQLSEQLSLSEIRAVTALDEEDHPLGQAFPERGVIFMYMASDSDALAADGELPAAVSHVVLQRLDPLAFVMRAENSLHGNYSQNITDLETAIAIDPKCAHAYFLLAKIYLATGQADLADKSASTACELDPNNASYQLVRGRTQEMLGEYDSAVLTVRAVLDREDIAPIDKAQALFQIGCLASLGDVEIASKAIGFQTRAIEIADSVAASANGKERRAAKQILVEAHMAVAEEVARQAFNQKVENLSLWVGRASGIAEDYIAKDGGSVELRLIIAQRALNALASFRPTLDPGPWVAEAEEASQAMFAQSDDELWQTHVKWELGLAYLNALRVEHVRRETQNALQYGNKAVELLAAGAASRQAVHSSEQLIGLLYFQIGAVQAVHQLDHVKAAQWYDKAEPLLAGPRPKSELYAPRREGEMLVSMGVTYWQLGEQNRALTLTQNGVNLVESAVEAGILAKSTLGVPYGNLATMYQKLGESSNAAKYSELAKTVAGSDPPRVGQTENVRQTSGAMKTSAQRPRPIMQRPIK
jgi:tetratricopeptide (TPR) repeat protein